MGTDSQDSYQPPSFPRLNFSTLRAYTDHTQLSNSEDEHECRDVDLEEISVPTERTKRKGSPKAQIEACSPSASRHIDPHAPLSKRQRKEEDGLAIPPVVRLVLDCVEIVVREQAVVDSSIPEIDRQPEISSEFRIDRVKSSWQKSLAEPYVSQSLSPVLAHPMGSEEDLKLPERFASEPVKPEASRRVLGEPTLSRRQKSIITLDSQDSHSDFSCELEEERIQFLNVFREHEEALFQADTFQHFMECKSQLARKQRIYNSSPHGRVEDSIGHAINHYTAKSLEEISYFEDQIIFLRMNLVQNLKALAQERDENLDKWRDSPYPTHKLMTDSPESNWERARSDEIDSRLTPPGGGVFDDFGVRVATNGDKTTTTQAENSLIELEDTLELKSLGEVREPQVASSLTSEPEKPYLESDESESAIITTAIALLTAETIHETSLEPIKSPNVRSYSTIDSPSPPISRPSSRFNSPEMANQSHRKETDSLTAAVLCGEPDVQAPPLLSPLNAPLEDGHPNSCEIVSLSSTSFYHANTHEGMLSDILLDTGSTSHRPILEDAMKRESHLDEVRTPSDTFSLDNHPTSDGHANEVPPPGPQVHLIESQSWYERDSDQDSAGDEVDLLELYHPDELPAMYSAPSAVPSNSSFTHTYDISFNSDLCTFEPSISESQPFLLLSDIANSTSEVTHLHSINESMPNYRDMSFDSLKVRVSFLIEWCMEFLTARTHI
ncbi:hypothetical protein K493DRAFT_319330 [Basidiobolus meristosporus CBS 931.73]|uniref:Uncharacterized protein n=1 Tax=Basidiobolus meristosporus CBS 931.73 TaxID=1314790 RepID=A0A1Y1XS93_9FUNG|nr:hypothetical protein K493DRAFT_319330 [Basidiobolus meristosporus CBS 931.73]|eukprot:ORX88629.1 hypothetical protein K493DRAFT_319330 [Basidiobolus meristosporus CBS 931.73]